MMLSFVTPTFDLYRDASNNKYFGLSIYVQGVNIFGDGSNCELIVKGENTFNSNDVDGISPGLSSVQGFNTNLDIVVKNGASLRSNSNGRYGFSFFLRPDAALNVEVKENGTFESCGNTGADIYGFRAGNVDFSGTGYL